MNQDRLNNKDKDLKGLKRQTESLLSIAWQKGYVAGFNDGYATRRDADKIEVTRMNNDLISREALKKAIQNREECKECTDIDCIHCFYDIIDNAPTVELDGYVLYGTGLEVVATDWLDEQLGKDRRRGEWLSKEIEIFSGTRITTFICNHCNNSYSNMYNFCPNCGADMRGDNK